MSNTDISTGSRAGGFAGAGTDIRAGTAITTGTAIRAGTDTRAATNVEARHHILRARECLTSGERAALHRRYQRGEIVRVGRGSYLEKSQWDLLDARVRYLLRVHATAASLDPQTQFSHHSAVALWNLPWVDGWPDVVHTASEPAAGGRATASVFRHATGTSDNPVMIDGLAVSPLARTVADIARVASFESAVVIADAALRRTAHPIAGLPVTTLTHRELYEELDLVPLRRGSAKVRSVIEFANALADRPGESLSRVNIHRAGLPAPLLQAPLRGQSGRRWFADFWWPKYDLIGEFDGRWKYSDPTFMRGRTAHQVLLDEKEREDDLRAAGYKFSRWDWEKARSASRLRAHLLAAGLR